MEAAGSSSPGPDPFGAEYVNVSKFSPDEESLQTERPESSDFDLHPEAAQGISSEVVEQDASGLRSGDQEGSAREEKRTLPENLAKGVVFLECESSAEGGSCDVYLVGTAHVSQVLCSL